MQTTLQIKDLRIETHIGVYEWEQRILQSLLLDINIPMQISEYNDLLTDTLDYDVLCQKVTAFVENKSFNLIETVATQVAQLIKDEFHINNLQVKVSKPHAIKNAGCVSVIVDL